MFLLNIIYISFNTLPVSLNGQAVDVPMLAKCSSGNNYSWYCQLQKFQSELWLLSS